MKLYVEILVEAAGTVGRQLSGLALTQIVFIGKDF